MNSSTLIGGHKAGLNTTMRTDKWWIGPLLSLSILTGFLIYATWALIQGDHYWVADTGQGFGGYLSPFFSPVLLVDPSVPGAVPESHAWFGTFPSWWPSFIPASPAVLILMFPAMFRFTCYYYRKTYYRAFTGTPPGCSVGALPQKNYRGETRFLLVQNLHRYALYFAIIFVVILSYDAVQAFFRDGKFGVGVGSIILTLNAIFLACYTFGCHSFRHLIGGSTNKFSCSAARYTAWKGCTKLNEKHMNWAWTSLFWVAGSDVYVRLVSSGVITDYNTWG
ncbi:MAG: succinate dehydrogenase [Myxococcales bacterium]|nr:succinate dehydrogenase [Myxococcales bacterium]